MEVQRAMDDEIDLMEYCNVIRKRKKFIIIIVAAVVALSITVTLLMPNIYQAKAVITPIQPELPTGGVSSLLSSVGLAAQSSSVIDVVSLLNSKILRERIIRRNNLLQVLFTPDDLKAMTEDEKLWEGLEYLEKTLIVIRDEKTNIITISMDLKDPVMAARIVDFTLKALSDHMAEEGKRVAMANKKYLEEQLNTTADPLIKTKIYELISKQIEKAVMAEVKENSAFKIVDPPKVPVEKSKPKRSLIVIAAFMFSLVLAVFIALIREFIAKNKSVLSKEDKRCS